MRKNILLPIISIVILTACKSKNASKPAATPADSFEANLIAGKTRFPDITVDVLKKGHSIYYGGCTNCHRAKNIERRDEKEWIEVLDAMAPKAKLLPEEKDAVWKYIMSVKLLAVK